MLVIALLAMLQQTGGYSMTRTMIATIALAATTAVLVAVPLVVPTGAAAQNGERGALRTACMDDYKKFCAAVERGGGRIVACLRAHEGELAPACRSALASAKR